MHLVFFSFKIDLNYLFKLHNTTLGNNKLPKQMFSRFERLHTMSFCSTQRLVKIVEIHEVLLQILATGFLMLKHKKTKQQQKLTHTFSSVHGDRLQDCRSTKLGQFIPPCFGLSITFLERSLTASGPQVAEQRPQSLHALTLQSRAVR